MRDSVYKTRYSFKVRAIMTARVPDSGIDADLITDIKQMAAVGKASNNRQARRFGTFNPRIRTRWHALIRAYEREITTLVAF